MNAGRPWAFMTAKQSQALDVFSQSRPGWGALVGDYCKLTLGGCGALQKFQCKKVSLLSNCDLGFIQFVQSNNPRWEMTVRHAWNADFVVTVCGDHLKFHSNDDGTHDFTFSTVEMMTWHQLIDTAVAPLCQQADMITLWHNGEILAGNKKIKHIKTQTAAVAPAAVAPAVPEKKIGRAKSVAKKPAAKGVMKKPAAKCVPKKSKPL